MIRLRLASKCFKRIALVAINYPASPPWQVARAADPEVRVEEALAADPVGRADSAVDVVVLAAALAASAHRISAKSAQIPNIRPSGWQLTFAIPSRRIHKPVCRRSKDGSPTTI